ncbi:dihydroxyacetone kinase subunit DhaL [Burkholderiaceae bacterium]
MGLEVVHIVHAVRIAEAAMVRLETVLNEADALIGDADTGSMLSRVLRAMATATSPQVEDVGLAFTRLACAATSATGSSLGTLLATALLTIGRATKDRNEVPWQEFGDLLGSARDAMASRGGAKLGDKTVLDALDAVARTVASFNEKTPVLATAAARSANEALVRFRPYPCRVGRARMFPEKSKGSDDPGMLAFSLLLNELASSTNSKITH